MLVSVALSFNRQQEGREPALQLSKAEAVYHTQTDETPAQQAALAGSEGENAERYPPRKALGLSGRS